MWTHRHSHSKILNALDLPCPQGSREPHPHTTELIAWHLTAGHHGVDHAAPYMTEHMRWYLVGHQHCLTGIHIDSDGLATEVEPLDGGKIWGFIRERPSNPLSSIDFFLRPDFTLETVLDSADYDIEAIVLRPGDRLYVRYNIVIFFQY